ncbi:MAG: replication initiation protein [Hyphomicrobium sp.]
MSEPKVLRKSGSDLGVATRRNELLLGSYRLSIWAQRFFLLLISKVKDTDADDCVYWLSISELASVIDVDQNVYREVFAIVQELASTWVTVDSLDEPTRPVRVGLVVNRMDAKGMRVDGDRTYLGGTVAVGIHKELLPYVKRARARFTSVELQYAFRLLSTYSQRMYDILKTQEFHGHDVEWTIEDVRRMLSMGDSEMARYPDFRRFVIERAIKDINARTDITVKYKPRKTGNRVTHLKFRIASKKSMAGAVPFMAAGREDDLYRRLIKAGLAQLEAVEIVKQWGRRDADRITWHLAEMERKQKAGEIKRSPLAWLRAGIKTDYRPQKGLPFDENIVKRRRQNDPESADGGSRDPISMRELLKVRGGRREGSAH